MGRKEWIIVGRRLGGIGRCNQWWLGDWVRYGNEKWGQKYTVASKITGYDPRTLANMSSIAAAFTLSRRRDVLTWSHHAAVAALPIEKQDAWLNRAVAEKLSVADLRTELRVWQKHVGDGDALTDEESTMDREEGEIACPKCGYRMSVLA